MVGDALDMMTGSTPSRVLGATVFTLVLLAYLSVWFWRPADAYGPSGREGVSPALAVLMVSVFLVSLLSWNRYRVIAAFGLLSCFLWVAVMLLPVL